MASVIGLKLSFSATSSSWTYIIVTPQPTVSIIELKKDIFLATLRVQSSNWFQVVIWLNDVTNV